MNVDNRLNLSLSQRLVMTPMLQQAIKLLQMSRLELVETVRQEVLENPVLEELDDSSDLDRQEDDFSLDGQMPERPEDRHDESAAAPELPENDGDNRAANDDHAVNWEEYFDDNPGGLGYSGEFEPDDNTQSFDNLLTRPQSLAEHLAWQLQMSQLPEREMKIGQFLIGQIGEDGYLFHEHHDDAPAINIYASNTPFKQLEEHRRAIIATLSQKLNVEFEREYLFATLNFSGAQAMLANVVLQEYYDEIVAGRYAEIVAKLRYFTLEEYE